MKYFERCSVPPCLSRSWSSWQFFCYHDNTSLHSSASWLCGKCTRRQRGKKNVRHWGTAMEHRQTVATDWPTLTTNHLKAQLDLFEMLHISLILVSAFSAIYSHGKVCRSILQANPSLSSYINKASHMLWNSWSGFKGWFGGAINPLYLTHWRMSSHFFGLQSLDHN